MRMGGRGGWRRGEELDKAVKSLSPLNSTAQYSTAQHVGVQSDGVELS